MNVEKMLRAIAAGNTDYVALTFTDGVVKLTCGALCVSKRTLDETLQYAARETELGIRDKALKRQNELQALNDALQLLRAAESDT